jgi:hypothetical protein
MVFLRRIPVAYWLRKLRYFTALCRDLPGASPLKSIESTLDLKFVISGSAVQVRSLAPEIHTIQQFF